MRVLDLFSGIGGFTLGLERAGFTTVAFCEIDPFCREWLAQQWPHLPIYSDVRALDGRAVGPVDLVCGGFPCQDVSAAGSRRGLEGERSGLWFQMRRILSEVRPAWVAVENVVALRSRGADRVLGDLEALGYAVWPFVVGADDIGAPHRRKRVWIVGRSVADADRERLRLVEQRLSGRWPSGIRNEGEPLARDAREGMADADGIARERGQPLPLGREEGRTTAHGSSAAEVADANGGRCEGERLEDHGGLERTSGDLADGCSGARIDDAARRAAPDVGDADRARLEGLGGPGVQRCGSPALRPPAAPRFLWPAGRGEPQREWERPRVVTGAELRLGVSTDGIPGHMGAPLNRARLKAAGNSVVPQIAELLGRAILQAEAAWIS